MHTCPMESPVPHVGGPITGATCTTVLIEGLPAATIYSICTCTGPPNRIMSGAITVVVAGKYAARKHDITEHGGVITTGCATVLIGGQTGTILLEDKKANMIRQAIQDCMVMLQHKQQLLNDEDAATLQQFKKHFGRNDPQAVKTILSRIQHVLKIAGNLSEKNFVTVSNEHELRSIQAEVYPEDPSHIIRLDNSFWMALQCEKLKAGLLIHELSHFKDTETKDAGRTKDVVYDTSCSRLATYDSGNALNNADNFEYFIITENK